MKCNIPILHRCLATVLMLCFVLTVQCQYHVKPLDVSKKITALEGNENGMLYYGTGQGEFGLYDGLQFYRLSNVGARINVIKHEENAVILLTEKGLYRLKNGKPALESNGNLNVLTVSEDKSFLVTSMGVYDRINKDYFPNKEDFFDINEIKEAAYFKLGKKEYFRADEKVYIKEKSWSEYTPVGDEPFSILPFDQSRFLIANDSALVMHDNKGEIDTLYKLDSTTRTKIFRLSGSDVLLCHNNSIGVFNTRKKELNTIYSANTELITDAFEDDWGNIWVSAGSYLFQLIDRADERTQQPPKISITSIRLNGEDKGVGTSFRIDYKNSEIEIDYNGVHLTYPQNLDFQYSLAKKAKFSANQSLDRTWSEPTKNKNVEYRNLSPGNYSFQVRATVDGTYYTYSDPVQITVQKDEFQSIWLFGILAAMSILVVALYFNNRYNTLKDKSEQVRNRLIQENKMLSLQQKTLQLQMNPHFVFNALNSIQGLIANQQNKKARRYLQEFSTMMRSVLNQSREEDIELNEEVKYLKSYLNLEQMANNDKFDWVVEVDENVEDDIRIPTMLIQPFVENSILHGVKPLKERRGNIRVRFEKEGRKIRCEVRDNGIGLKAASSMKSSGHKSVAIDVVKERLQSRAKSADKDAIQYRDITDKHSTVTGTSVVIWIPIVN